MISEINIEEYLKLAESIPVIDVRSPVEFEKGHIPDAINIPVFSNDERSHVGTVYKQRSTEEAITLGLEYVNLKLDYFIKRSFEIAPQGLAIVHCWRGGMRSHDFATHLAKNGFVQIYLIAGGYKAFRNHVINSFNENTRLNILGGFTGSGKTQILNFLESDGMQVIDLERHANHKGSAFGNIENSPQPTQEQFENDLFLQWNKSDFLKPLWLEDESLNIGSVQLPKTLYQKMVTAPVYFLEIPKEERAKHLVDEYADADKAMLANAILKISKRLGDLNTRRSLEFLDHGNFFETAMILLDYYDKAYLQMLSHRDLEKVFPIKLNTTNNRENATIVKEYINM